MPLFSIEILSRNSFLLASQTLYFVYELVKTFLIKLHATLLKRFLNLSALV